MLTIPITADNNQISEHDEDEASLLLKGESGPSATLTMNTFSTNTSYTIDLRWSIELVAGGPICLS